MACATWNAMAEAIAKYAPDAPNAIVAEALALYAALRVHHKMTVDEALRAAAWQVIDLRRRAAAEARKRNQTH